MADVEEYETAMIVDTERRNEFDDREYWKQVIAERLAGWVPTCDESDIGGLDGADF